MALNDRFEMRTNPELTGEIEDWRTQLRPVPSRGEAIRRLVKKGLEASRKEDKASKDGGAVS